MISQRAWFPAVLVVATGALGACTAGDGVPAVASVTVTPARTRMGLGGPIELTYRFDVLPGAAIGADYHVFTHLVDGDGRTVWIDGHDPAVPTSAWKAGQTVQYTRTQFLPTTDLPPGDVTLLVGLNREDRLPLQTSAGLRRDRAYPVANLQIAPESENLFLIYTSGWHGQEHADDARLTWTWTERVGALSFKNPKTDVVLYLEYDARPDAFGGKPQVVTVSVLGQPVATFSADARQLKLERIAIPAAALGAGEMADIKIEVDRVFVPASLPAGGQDDRGLGLRIYHAFVERR